jgi:hypothetical protein
MAKLPFGENSGDVVFYHPEQTDEAIQEARNYCLSNDYISSESHKIIKLKQGGLIVKKK